MGKIIFIDIGEPKNGLFSVLYAYENMPEGLYRVVSGVNDPSKCLTPGQTYYLVHNCGQQLVRMDNSDVHHGLNERSWKSVELVEERDSPYGYYFN